MKFTAVLITLASLQATLAAPAGKLKLCETDRWNCFRGLTSMPNIAWEAAERAGQLISPFLPRSISMAACIMSES